MNIDNNIKLLRDNIGLSQSKLAALVGVDRSAVAQWENGKAFPRKHHLIRLAEVLETSPATLIDNAPNEAAFIPLIDTKGELTGQSLEVPIGLFERHPSAQAIVMPDESMDNLIPCGMAVVFDPELVPANGQIAAVHWEGTVLVRHLFRGGNTLMLASDGHAAYDDVLITKPYADYVLGTVIWAQSADELR